MDNILKNNEIRSKWYNAWFYNSMWTVFYWINYFVIHAYGEIAQGKEFNFLEIFLYIPLLIGFIYLISYWQYYCAYKKHGTGLLTMISIFGIFRILNNSCKTVLEYKPLFLEFGFTNSIMNYCYFIEIISFIVSIYFWYQCLRLLKVNLSYKKKLE